MHMANTAPGHAMGFGVGMWVGKQYVPRLAHLSQLLDLCAILCGECVQDVLFSTVKVCHLRWCGKQSVSYGEVWGVMGVRDASGSKRSAFSRGFKHGLALNGGSMGWKAATLPWVNDCECVWNKSWRLFASSILHGNSGWMDDGFATAQWALRF